MTVELRFTVPGSPVPKGRPRARAYIDRQTGEPRAIIYTPETTDGYESTVAAHAAKAVLVQGWRVAKADRLAVSVCLFWADLRRRDLDNAAKSVLDALNGGVWADDSQIDDLRILRRLDRERPRAFVVVRKLVEGLQP